MYASDMFSCCGGECLRVTADGVDWLWIFFFFKQKTAYEMRISDWSSDVCSSDLARGFQLGRRERSRAVRRNQRHRRKHRPDRAATRARTARARARGDRKSAV